jgi:hypothetical protein
MHACLVSLLVGLTTLGQPRLSEALNPTSMQRFKLKGRPETG